VPQRPRIIVLGSINLDIVASVARLPAAGETVSGAALNRYPGGKGANQALAAQRLGASVALFGCVGDDAEARAALALLRTGGVDLSGCTTAPEHHTGLALISVSAQGENQIVVAPGANLALRGMAADLPAADALIAQLEIPVDEVCDAAAAFEGLVCLNLAPAIPIPAQLPDLADVIVVNETEAAWYDEQLHNHPGLLAVTRGSAGAVLYRAGREVARAAPPAVRAIDTTGAGDCFTAALTVALIEGAAPQAALEFACTAGAIAATTPGAQPALPFREQVDRIMTPPENPPSG